MNNADSPKHETNGGRARLLKGAAWIGLAIGAAATTASEGCRRVFDSNAAQDNQPTAVSPAALTPKHQREALTLKRAAEEEALKQIHSLFQAAVQRGAAPAEIRKYIAQIEDLARGGSFSACSMLLNFYSANVPCLPWDLKKAGDWGREALKLAESAEERQAVEEQLRLIGDDR